MNVNDYLRNAEKALAAAQEMSSPTRYVETDRIATMVEAAKVFAIMALAAAATRDA